ncbi:intradiol ring-cleavage dioxygenase [Actinoplanes sp. NPDC051851]|uniref:intradiol ring-cleavage dioxygenase n=1 Tax=Actinoplanes sp. NPDC051851 TaxID=3154753 RepID=UPI0034245DD3
MQKKDDNEAYVREVHDKGLAFDLRTMSRRKMLAGFTGGVAAVAVGGGMFFDRSTSYADTTCDLTEVPDETNGPYPADGTNGIDIRTAEGVVRSDITTSFGDASGVAEGIPLTVNITVEDLECTPLSGVAVYIWHCDRDGNYSLYSTAIADENYLRGIQEADASGTVSFTTIFPGCYLGRWPHIHFEVYASLDDATSGAGAIVKTSQLGFPEDVCDEAYATDGYSSSVSNLAQITLATDNVFSDGYDQQMATVTGSATEGYTASLTIAVDES